MDLQFLSRILPMTLGTVTLLVAAALLYHMTRKTEGPNPARFDDELVGENATKAPPEHQLQWFVGLIVTALLVGFRSEEHTSELQSLMRISYAVFCLKKKRETQKKEKRKTGQDNMCTTAQTAHTRHR